MSDRNRFTYHHYGDGAELPTVRPEHRDIGESVHYVARGSADGVFPPVDRAATIAAIDVDPEDPMAIDAVVLNPGGMFFNQRLKYDRNRAPGTWHWQWDEHE